MSFAVETLLTKKLARKNKKLKKYKEALEAIAACDGQTLLGCAPEHEYVPGHAPAEERAHEYGAYKAFNQCAAIARRALSTKH